MSSPLAPVSTARSRRCAARRRSCRRPSRRRLAARDGRRRSLLLRARDRRALDLAGRRDAARPVRRATRGARRRARARARPRRDRSPAAFGAGGRAGLRTFAPDRVPVLGEDPVAPGFWWLAGQGGAGIKTAPAMAQLLALAMDGALFPTHRLDSASHRELSPAVRDGVAITRSAWMRGVRATTSNAMRVATNSSRNANRMFEVLSDMPTEILPPTNAETTPAKPRTIATRRSALRLERLRHVPMIDVGTIIASEDVPWRQRPGSRSRPPSPAPRRCRRRRRADRRARRSSARRSPS